VTQLAARYNALGPEALGDGRAAVVSADVVEIPTAFGV
jgi:hypothetical protein